MQKKFLNPIPLHKIIDTTKNKYYKCLNLSHINEIKSLDIYKTIRSSDDKKQF